MFKGKVKQNKTQFRDKESSHESILKSQINGFTCFSVRFSLLAQCCFNFFFCSTYITIYLIVSSFNLNLIASLCRRYKLNGENFNNKIQFEGSLFPFRKCRVQSDRNSPLSNHLFDNLKSTVPPATESDHHVRQAVLYDAHP